MPNTFLPRVRRHPSQLHAVKPYVEVPIVGPVDYVIRAPEGAELGAYTDLLDALDAAHALVRRTTIFKRTQVNETALAHQGPAGWRGPGRQTNKETT